MVADWCLLRYLMLLGIRSIFVGKHQSVGRLFEVWLLTDVCSDTLCCWASGQTFSVCKLDFRKSPDCFRQGIWRARPRRLANWHLLGMFRIYKPSRASNVRKLGFKCQIGYKFRPCSEAIYVGEEHYARPMLLKTLLRERLRFTQILCKIDIMLML